MGIYYNASGKASSGEVIYGYVVINRQHNVVDGRLKYSIVNCHFSCDGFPWTGSSAGDISLPLGGPQPDSLISGSGLWRLGEWITDTGAWFKHVDGSRYQDKISEYQHLAPIIVLCCDNAEINSKGPFIPSGHLLLTWNPHPH